MGPTLSQKYFNQPDQGYVILRQDIFQFHKRDRSQLEKLFYTEWRWNKAKEPWDPEILKSNNNKKPLWAINHYG